LKRISLKRYDAMLLKRSFDEESDEGSACVSDDEESLSNSAKTASSRTALCPDGTMITDLRSCTCSLPTRTIRLRSSKSGVEKSTV